ncbi:DUF1127 domain-containing protein [Paragemmobacter straminiformis]|uniref:DUF1127 domain-containing protein n=1 Tax=Paragemmobacter straminiformis TaxID=2045119 RepID=A0A842I427_9RHOB|nr:DUF1127 domain-containing protein [Gemmobacter straminiformis]MBC2834275.1 DUF1127 domain-containing protein [Gemmobacter straminiformis]
MFDRIRAFLDRWHDLKSVDALSDRELDDLGMSRAQIAEFIAIPADVPDRIARMAAVFGIPEAELQARRADYLELLSTCHHCPDRAACTLALHKGDIRSPADAAFCPNAEIYAGRSPLAA